jgi:hypothetical protein
MTCPYLKEVRMVFCRAYPVKKLVPLDQLVPASACATECAFQSCAAFQEARARGERAADEGALIDDLTAPDLTTQGPDRPGKGPTP